MKDWDKLWPLFLLGAVVGFAKLLDSKEVITLRIAIGRSVSTGAIATAAGLAIIWIPDIPFTAVLALAAALASLGTSALERIFQRFLGNSGAQ